MCSKDTLLELGRQINACEAHGDLWCSCKVRQYISLLGLSELDEGGEVRFMTGLFPKVPTTEEHNEQFHKKESI